MFAPAAIDGRVRGWPLLVGAGLVAVGCAGPLGRAPLVLTEVPNRASGRAFLALAAERGHCVVSTPSEERMRLVCPEGELVVPTFSGPPTFAVQCVDPRLQDLARCSAVVRRVLLASEGR
jgi:hypothetical protein